MVWLALGMRGPVSLRVNALESAVLFDHTSPGRDAFGGDAVDGTQSWWATHWSEVVAVLLAAGFLALVGTAVRSSLLLGRVAADRRVRQRRADDGRRGDNASAIEWRTALRELEARIERIEARLESAGDEAPEVLARLDADPTDVKARILELARRGLAADEIARELDEPVGRVQLTLNLRRTSSGH